MSEFSETYNFFNVTNLKDVNYYVLRMITENNTRPAWLAGKSKLEMLPRWSDPSTLSYCYPIVHLTGAKTAKRLLWIVENLTHGWAISTQGILFETEDDMVMFRLKYS